MHVEELKKLALTALEDLKARDLVELDVREASSVTDFMLVASGTSSRQVCALAENLVARMKEEGIQPLGIEGLEAGDWVLVDLGDLLVHIMQPQTREFYDLEKLWGAFDPLERQA